MGIWINNRRLCCSFPHFNRIAATMGVNDVCTPANDAKMTFLNSFWVVRKGVVLQSTAFNVPYEWSRFLVALAFEFRKIACADFFCRKDQILCPYENVAASNALNPTG